MGGLEVGVLPVVLIFLVATAVTWLFIPRVRDFAVDVARLVETYDIIEKISTQDASP